MNFTFSFAGKKADAIQAVDAQVPDAAGAAILKSIINAQNATDVSLTGSATPTTIAISGSFWTVK